MTLLSVTSFSQSYLSLITEFKFSAIYHRVASMWHPNKKRKISWKCLFVKCRCSFRKDFNTWWAYWIMELRTATLFTTAFAAVTLLIKTSSLLFLTIPRRTVGRKFFSLDKQNACFIWFQSSTRIALFVPVIWSDIEILTKVFHFSWMKLEIR